MAERCSGVNVQRLLRYGVGNRDRRLPLYFRGIEGQRNSRHRPGTVHAGDLCAHSADAEAEPTRKIGNRNDLAQLDLGMQRRLFGDLLRALNGRCIRLGFEALGILYFPINSTNICRARPTAMSTTF